MKNLTVKRPTLLFKKVLHKNQVRLLLLFPYDNNVISIIRNLRLFTWSKTLRGWHSEFDLGKIKSVESVLKYDVIFEYDKSLKLDLQPKTKPTRNISDTNKDVIRFYVKFLQGRRYSKSTVRTYFTLVADFIEYVNDMPLEELSHKDIDRYLGEVFAPKGYSISAVKLLSQI